MRTVSTISLILILLTFAGCSNTRFLVENEMLYTGRKKIEIINTQHVKNSSSVKSYVKSVSSHKVNNSLFGRRILPPFGLWVHYYTKVDNQKKIKSWLYKSLSSSPVLMSDINPELRAKKIENELFDQGYFKTKTWSVIDTSARNVKKARVSYFVDLKPPFHYNKVEFDTLPYSEDSLVIRSYFRKQIKTGDQFDLNKLKSARNLLSRKIQDEGYFYFIPDFIDLRADTTAEFNKLDLVVGRKQELTQSALSIYKINNIIINISRPSDTLFSKSDTTQYDDITVISCDDIIKPELLINSVYFSKGDTYSYTEYQRTINRLNNLGVFRYVNISFEQDKEDSLSYLLDVMIDIVMADNINVTFEANMVTKSTGFSGPALSSGISHGNTFKGAEKLHMEFNGGFEWQWGTKSESQLGTNSYEFGISSGLTFPEIIIPVSRKMISPMILQRTSVNLDLSILNRTAYYKMFSTKTNLNYQWSKNSDIRHSFYPLYLNSVNLLATTPAFDSVVIDNIYIRKSFEEQFILGLKYDFSYNNTLIIKPHNFFFQTGISTSGNFIDLFAGIGKGASERPYYFLNNIYSQYVKLITDFRYYRNGFNKALAMRVYAGIGIPYGNSTSLPYVEQFFSGGAYSIRGFTARNLGPGSYLEEQSGYIDQSGDLKLEANIEYRFEMSTIIKGAFFLETGNTWLVHEDENRPGSKFYFNTFYDQLAVGTGFGLRFDFTFFVLRADIGFPLRTPYTVDNRNWLFGTGNIFSGRLFYLAIGYPF